jgi:hypothetical protein
MQSYAEKFQGRVASAEKEIKAVAAAFKPKCDELRKNCERKLDAFGRLLGDAASQIGRRLTDDNRDTVHRARGAIQHVFQAVAEPSVAVQACELPKPGVVARAMESYHPAERGFFIHLDNAIEKAFQEFTNAFQSLPAQKDAEADWKKHEKQLREAYQAYIRQYAAPALVCLWAEVLDREHQPGAADKQPEIEKEKALLATVEDALGPELRQVPTQGRISREYHMVSGGGTEVKRVIQPGYLYKDEAGQEQVIRPAYVEAAMPEAV